MTPEEISEEPRMIEGSAAYDDRGSVIFFNQFNMQGIKRCYQVENISKEVIRAFHGHLQEEKYIYVTKGCAKIVCAKIEAGNMLAPPYLFLLNSKKPVILKIPKGYANGLKSLEENTAVIFLSTSTLEESKQDDLRFAWNYFGNDIWETKNR